METIALALIAFLVLAMFLILWLGYVEGEEARAAAIEAAVPAFAHEAAGMLDPLAVVAAPAAASPEEAAVERLQDHVRRERRAVAAFVAEPSAETLVASGRSVGEAFVRELERRVRRERGAVGGFVSNPSLQALFAALQVPRLAAA